MTVCCEQGTGPTLRHITLPNIQYYTKREFDTIMDDLHVL